MELDDKKERLGRGCCRGNEEEKRQIEGNREGCLIDDNIDGTVFPPRQCTLHFFCTPHL